MVTQEEKQGSPQASELAVRGSRPWHRHRGEGTKMTRTHKIGQKVNQTAASWKMESAAQNLPATHLTGDNSSTWIKIHIFFFSFFHHLNIPVKINAQKIFSKRIQGTVAQKKLRLAMDAGAQHIYICEHHKNVIQVKMFLLDQQLLNSCQKIGTNLQKMQKD